MKRSSLSLNNYDKLFAQDIIRSTVLRWIGKGGAESDSSPSVPECQDRYKCPTHSCCYIECSTAYTLRGHLPEHMPKRSELSLSAIWCKFFTF